ncbi:hypothetical protein F0562_003551 [Nyssa sinensis]|uniref:Uncharacterized protein n=1 Tax=Nyssa sinensis TaxID=561372 RepID=A0A5J5BVU1_9ASTE|nr:hypothetical protein F0562_003551 [Nyssa sinensis]
MRKEKRRRRSSSSSAAAGAACAALCGGVRVAVEDFVRDVEIGGPMWCGERGNYGKTQQVGVAERWKAVIFSEWLRLLSGAVVSLEKGKISFDEVPNKDALVLEDAAPSTKLTDWEDIASKFFDMALHGKKLINDPDDVVTEFSWVLIGLDLLKVVLKNHVFIGSELFGDMQLGMFQMLVVSCVQRLPNQDQLLNDEFSVSGIWTATRQG